MLLMSKLSRDSVDSICSDVVFFFSLYCVSATASGMVIVTPLAIQSQRHLQFIIIYLVEDPYGRPHLSIVDLCNYQE